MKNQAIFSYQLNRFKVKTCPKIPKLIPLLLTMIFDPSLSIILSLIKNICQVKNTPSPKVLSFDTLICKREVDLLITFFFILV